MPDPPPLTDAEAGRDTAQRYLLDCATAFLGGIERALGAPGATEEARAYWGGARAWLQPVADRLARETKARRVGVGEGG